MEHVENIQPIKVKKASKSDSKNKPNNQKWAVLSISSIPLVMTLREFNAYSSASRNGKSTGDISFSSEYDYYRLLAL